MKTVVRGLLLVNALLLSVSVANANPITIVSALVALPCLLYLLLVVVPRAERAVDRMLSDDE